jgi:hypothetical protein
VAQLAAVAVDKIVRTAKVSSTKATVKDATSKYLARGQASSKRRAAARQYEALRLGRVARSRRMRAGRVVKPCRRTQRVCVTGWASNCRSPDRAPTPDGMRKHMQPGVSGVRLGKLWREFQGRQGPPQVPVSFLATRQIVMSAPCDGRFLDELDTPE